MSEINQLHASDLAALEKMKAREAVLLKKNAS